MSLWGIVSLIIILSFPATGYGQNRTVDHQFEAYKYGNQFIDFDSTKSSSIQVISGAELGPDAVPSELVDGVVQNYIPSTSRFNSDSLNKAIIQNQDELSQYEIKVDKEIIHLSKDSSTQEGKFHVWLSGSPSNPVKISFEIDHSIIRFLPSGLIFDKANFDEKQKVAVYGVEDHLPTFESQIITITAIDLGLEEHAKGADETSKFRTIRLEHMDHGKANDDPELIYEMETFYVEEGKTNEDFEVRIGGESPPSEPVTVTVTVTDNTEDLSLVTVGTKVTQLIFPPIPTPSDWFWNNPQFVTVIAKRDRDDINDSGTIKVEASGGGFDGLGGDVDIVILDNNDAPNPSVVSFHSPQSMTTELAGGIFPIRVNIDPSTEIGFILMYSVSGTASQTRPVDYQIPRSVTVPPNSDKVNIPVTVVGDPFPENDETVIITLTSTDDYQVGQPNVHTLTITDSSDQPDRPLINFINTSSSVTENDIETHNVEITIVSPSSSDLTLNYSIDGTATAGGDYTIPQSVTMNANATSVNIPIDVIDDQEVEDPDETIILTFSDNEEYDLGNIRRHTVTIIDDDVRIPVVNFTSSASSEEEDDIRHNVNLIIDPPSTTSFTLNYNIAGNATLNQDYTSPLSVTINANDTSVNIPVDIIDDTIIEDPETVIFTLIDGPEYDIGTSSEYVLTIIDDDLEATPVVGFSERELRANEADGQVMLDVYVRPASTSDFILRYRLGGTATRAMDYRANESVRVPANASSVKIPIEIIDDEVIEDLESITLTFIEDDHYDLSPFDPMFTVIITDNDYPEVAFDFAESTAPENKPRHEIKINIDPAPREMFTLNYRYNRNSTATFNKDFFISDLRGFFGQIDIAENTSSTAIEIEIIDDQIFESDETVILTLLGNEVGVINQHTLTIIDDDVRIPVVNFTSSASSEEEDDIRHNVNLIIDPPSTTSFTLNYNIAGNATLNQDYTSPLSVTINANDTSVNIPVDIIDDTIIEDPETVIFTLIDGPEYDIGTSSEYVLTIIDDDLEATPVVGFSERELRANEADGQVMLDVYVRPASTSDFILRYRLGGTATRAMDYRANESVRVPANASSVKIPIEIIDDEVIEDLESITLTFIEDDQYDLPPFNPMFTVTIIDDDDIALPIISIYPNEADEDDEEIYLTVSLDRPSDDVVIVGYEDQQGSAKRRSDYNASSGLVIFDPGATSGVIQLTLIDDTQSEENEVFQVQLQNPRHAILSEEHKIADATIIDNDHQAKIRIDDAIASEDATEIIFQVSLSQPSTQLITLQYQTEDGSATSGEDYAAVSGIVNFAPGTVVTAISVPLLLVDMDQIEKTFLVHLMSPESVPMDKSTAVATITESEDIISNILRNYTARFIRTSSIHVVEALQERLRPSPSACAAKERSDMARLWHNASTLEPTLGELLSDCRISQSITTKTKKTFSIWGRGAYRQFQGRGQEIRSLRGNVTSGLLGADYQWNSNWMVGVMLARHQGDGSFDINQESGDIQSALSAVYPYLTYINSEIEIWLSGGLGQGHTQINPNIDQNLTSRFGAAGLQGHLMTLKPMKFQYYGDVLLTDATFSSTDLRAHVFRVRLGLEGALHISELIHPYVEASVRQDGGSAENGFGMEMGGGVRVTVPQWNLRGNLRSQGLIMHTAEGFTEWGFSGAIQIGQASQGFMASLRPSWGASRGGILYHQQTLLHVGTLQQGQHQTEIELRYAIPLQHGILSSIMGITEYAYGRSFRLGGELRPRKQFRLSLSGLAHQKSTTVENFGVNMTGLIQY